jgi:hypothetical protein
MLPPGKYKDPEKGPAAQHGGPAFSPPFRKEKMERKKKKIKIRPLLSRPFLFNTSFRSNIPIQKKPSRVQKQN